MCLAVPMRVESVSGKTAEVVFEDVRKKALLGLVDVEPGDYVLVSRGRVVERLGEKQGREFIGAWKQLLD